MSLNCPVKVTALYCQYNSTHSVSVSNNSPQAFQMTKTHNYSASNTQTRPRTMDSYNDTSQTVIMFLEKERDKSSMTEGPEYNCQV